MTSLLNWYGSDNWDVEVLGAYQQSLKRRMVTRLNALFSGKIVLLPVGSSRQLIEEVSRLEDSLEGLERVYALLADDASRTTLVKVLAYRLLGHHKVKLPLNTPSYWSQRERMQSLNNRSDTATMHCSCGEMRRLALSQVGYPIELYYPPGRVEVFVLEHYAYRKRKPEIRAREGNYVIDGGACWGDTTLYFAHHVGERGKVYAFEFAPDNLEVLTPNIGLNPHLSPRIEVVSRALWERSGETVRFAADGPATSVALEQRSGEGSFEVETVTIDDFVKERRLPRVDYIKMDIEGAELSALKGAENTIRSFKPDLAISVYHRDRDFVEIPAYLDQLQVGYEFFLDHFTICGTETVLFATPATQAADR